MEEQCYQLKNLHRNLHNSLKIMRGTYHIGVEAQFIDIYRQDVWYMVQGSLHTITQKHTHMSKSSGMNK